MGKVNDSILAGTSGRTGRVVIANLNGLEYTRIRPKKTSKAPTSKQLLIQQRMKLTTEFMTSYRTFACKHFGHRIGAKSTYNLAMTNILNSLEIDFENNNIIQHYPHIAFSRGILPSFYLKELTRPTPLSVKIDWMKNTGVKPERDSDLLQILVVPKKEYETYFFEDLTQRAELSYSLTLPSQLEGKVLHFYAAFKSENEEFVSNSTYIGSVT